MARITFLRKVGVLGMFLLLAILLVYLGSLGLHDKPRPSTCPSKCAMSPRGDLVAFRPPEHPTEVQIWKGGIVLVTLKGHSGIVHSFAFSPDGNRLATASDDCTVRIWDVPLGNELLILRGHSDAVVQAIFTRDGQQIYSASADLTVRSWNSGSGAELAVFRGLSATPNSLAVSFSGSALASGSSDGRILVWDLRSGQLSLTLSGLSETVARNLYFSANDNCLVQLNFGSLSVWELPGGELILEVFSPACHVSEDGKQLQWNETGAEGTAVFWDFVVRNPTGIQLGRHGVRNRVVFGPDCQQLLSVTYEGQTRTWNQNSLLERPRVMTNMLEEMVFSPDGKRLASFTADGRVTVWDLLNGEPVAILAERYRAMRNYIAGHSSALIAFSPDGQLLATAGWPTGNRHPYDITVWDLSAQGQERYVLKSRDKGMPAKIVFSPDGKRLAVSYSWHQWDRSFVLWDITKGEKTLTAEGVAQTFSPDGARLAVDQLEEGLTVWDLQCEKQILHLSTISARHVAFSPDSNLLGTLGDGKLSVLDLETERIIRTVGNREACQLEFSGDGQHMILIGGTLLKRPPSCYGSFSPTLQKAQSGEVKIWTEPVGKDAPHQELPAK